MTLPRDTLVGSNFRLEPFDESRITERYLSWLRDPAVTRFLEVRHVPQTKDTASEFVRSFAGLTEKYMWAIIPQTSPDPIGTCTLFNINRIHGSAEISLMIGDRAYWGSGASEEIIAILADYAFDRLGLRRLTGGSYSNHHGMNFTFRRIGFRLEGRMQKAYRFEGTYVDGYRWAILADEWRARRQVPHRISSDNRR